MDKDDKDGGQMEFGEEHVTTYPVPTSPLARGSDPITSKAAAEQMRGSAELGSVQRLALSLLRLHPGSTANELTRRFPTGDSRKIGRRLSELQAAGLVRVEGTKVDPVTGRAGLRWWPT